MSKSLGDPRLICRVRLMTLRSSDLDVAAHDFRIAVKRSDLDGIRMHSSTADGFF